MSQDQISAIEKRLRIVENKLAAHEVAAAHPPSTDSGTADPTLSPDAYRGEFSRGRALDGARSVDAIAAFIEWAEHDGAVVNRWELVRADDCWMIMERAVRPAAGADS